MVQRWKARFKEFAPREIASQIFWGIFGSVWTWAGGSTVIAFVLGRLSETPWDVRFATMCVAACAGVFMWDRFTRPKIVKDEVRNDSATLIEGRNAIAKIGEELEAERKQAKELETQISRVEARTLALEHLRILDGQPTFEEMIKEAERLSKELLEKIQSYKPPPTPITHNIFAVLVEDLRRQYDNSVLTIERKFEETFGATIDLHSAPRYLENQIARGPGEPDDLPDVYKVLYRRTTDQARTLSEGAREIMGKIAIRRQQAWQVISR